MKYSARRTPHFCGVLRGMQEVSSSVLKLPNFKNFCQDFKILFLVYSGLFLLFLFLKEKT
jgi:hypothetical protein